MSTSRVSISLQAERRESPRRRYVVSYAARPSTASFGPGSISQCASSRRQTERGKVQPPTMSRGLVPVRTRASCSNQSVHSLCVIQRATRGCATKGGATHWRMLALTRRLKRGALLDKGFSLVLAVMTRLLPCSHGSATSKHRASTRCGSACVLKVFHQHRCCQWGRHVLCTEPKFLWLDGRPLAYILAGFSSNFNRADSCIRLAAAGTGFERAACSNTHVALCQLPLGTTRKRHCRTSTDLLFRAATRPQSGLCVDRVSMLRINSARHQLR